MLVPWVVVSLVWEVGDTFIRGIYVLFSGRKLILYLLFKNWLQLKIILAQIIQLKIQLKIILAYFGGGILWILSQLGKNNKKESRSQCDKMLVFREAKWRVSIIFIWYFYVSLKLFQIMNAKLSLGENILFSPKFQNLL